MEAFMTSNKKMQSKTNESTKDDKMLSIYEAQITGVSQKSKRVGNSIVPAVVVTMTFTSGTQAIDLFEKLTSAMLKGPRLKIDVYSIPIDMNLKDPVDKDDARIGARKGARKSMQTRHLFEETAHEKAHDSAQSKRTRKSKSSRKHLPPLNENNVIGQDIDGFGRPINERR